VKQIIGSPIPPRGFHTASVIGDKLVHFFCEVLVNSLIFDQVIFGGSHGTEDNPSWFNDIFALDLSMLQKK
jgi:hypothetical protein